MSRKSNQTTAGGLQQLGEVAKPLVMESKQSVSAWLGAEDLKNTQVGTSCFKEMLSICNSYMYSQNVT